VELDEVDTLDGLEGEEGAQSAPTFAVLLSQETDELTIGGDILNAILLQNLARAFVVHAGHQVQHLVLRCDPLADH
jgi:hypothetical protein